MGPGDTQTVVDSASAKLVDRKSQMSAEVDTGDGLNALIGAESDF